MIGGLQAGKAAEHPPEDPRASPQPPPPIPQRHLEACITKYLCLAWELPRDRLRFLGNFKPLL